MKKTLLILLTFFFAVTIFADNLDAAKEAKNQPKATGLKKDGIKPFLGVTANGTMNNNSSVIGQTDGTTFIFGVSLNGSLDVLQGNNEIGLTLELNEQFSRTPIIDRFIKSGDLLKIDAGYLYHISKTWGPFASALMKTAILDGYDERVTDVTYSLDGRTEDGDRIKLTSSFAPMLFKETFGLFYKPIDSKMVSLETKVGFGAIEVMADGNYVLADDAATKDLIELKTLESYNQAGASLYLKAKGGIDLAGQKLTYETYFDLLMPFIYDAPGKSSMDLTNMEYSLTISTKLFALLGIKYQLKMVKQPQLLDKWQVQNNIFLDLSYILIGTKKK